MPTLHALFLSVALTIAAPAAGAPLEKFCPSARPELTKNHVYEEVARQVFGTVLFGEPGDDSCINPVAFLSYPTGDVFLVSRGDPEHACHGCGASLSAYFFSHTPDGRKLVSWDRDFMSAGGSWGKVGDVKPVRFGGDDGVVIDSGGATNGTSTGWLELIVFVRGRAIPLTKTGSVRLSFDNSGAIWPPDPAKVKTVDGEWRMSPDGDQLDVVYTIRNGGHRETRRVIWRRKGERLVRVQGMPPKELEEE